MSRSALGSSRGVARSRTSRGGAPRPRGSRVASISFASLLLTLLTLVGISGGVAQAHAELIEVVPAPNSVVAEAPAVVTVRFTEPVSLSGGSTQVFDDKGAALETTGSVSGSTVSIELPAELADGTYVAAWRVISADSHPISGTSVFSVGAPSTTTPVDVDAGSDVPALASGWRVAATALTYAGVLITVGLWWLSRRWYRLAREVEGGEVDGGEVEGGEVEGGVGNHESDGDVGNRSDDGIFDALAGLDRWREIAAVTGIIGLLLALPARLVTVGGGWDALTDGSFLLDSLTGPIGVATAVTIAGTAGLVLVRPSQPGRSVLFAGLACTLVALGGFAVEGHTRTKEPGWLIVVSDVVHTSAGAIWLGGVVALAVTLRRTTGPWRARTALDVSWWAMWAVVAVTVTGVVMSMIVLRTFNALADTGYGLALMVKVALVVVLIAIGARNRLLLVPAIEESEMSDDPEPAEWAVRSLKRAVVVELVVFAALLVATATLVGRSPVVADADGLGEHDGTGVVEPVTVPLSSGVGSVTFLVDPAAVGTNMVMVTLVDDAGAPLALVEPPTVELREQTRGIGPLALLPADIGNSTFHAVTDIPFAGTWEVSVQARTSTFDSGLATTEFVVGE